MCSCVALRVSCCTVREDMGRSKERADVGGKKGEREREGADRIESWFIPTVSSFRCVPVGEITE